MRRLLLTLMVVLSMALATNICISISSAQEQQEESNLPAYSPKEEQAEKVETSSAVTVKATDTKAYKEGEATTHFNLASFYLHRWKLKLAEVELEESIAYWPTLKIAHRDLCITSFLQGNFLRAIAEFSVVVGLAEPLPLNEAEIVELNKKAAKLHYKQGLEYGSKAKWQQAVFEYQWALKYAPQNSAISHSLAFAFANTGNFDKAEAQYQTTFDLNPQDPYAHADLAFLLSDKGSQELAIAQMTKAVELSPNTAALHVDLGWLAEAHGNLADAEREFSEAIKLSPNHAGLWAHLGKVLEQEKKIPEAIAAYSKAVEISPTEPEFKTKLEELKGQKAEEPKEDTAKDKVAINAKANEGKHKISNFQHRKALRHRTHHR